MLAAIALFGHMIIVHMLIVIQVWVVLLLQLLQPYPGGQELPAHISSHS